LVCTSTIGPGGARRPFDAAEQTPNAAAVKAEEIVDTSWLKKLHGEGFFEKVYGGNISNWTTA